MPSEIRPATGRALIRHLRTYGDVERGTVMRIEADIADA
jgi:hypothetical protein